FPYLLLFCFHIRMFLPRHLPSLRYTAQNTVIVCWGYPRALGYPRRIPHTATAMAWGQASGAMPNFRLLHSHRGMATWRRMRVVMRRMLTLRQLLLVSHQPAPAPLGQNWGIKQGYG